MNTPILKPKSHSGGGGLWGSLGTIAGGVAGAVAAPFTAGASIPAGIAAGSALGGTAGALAGNALDPASMKDQRGISPLESAAKVDPEAVMAGLADGHNALMEDMSIPAPEKQRLSETMFKPAMNQIRGIK